MTLGNIFKSVLGSSSPYYHGYSASGNSEKSLSERNAAEYYHFGHYKTSKKKDKKHAILSALSLLAFLFFLNILHGCIQEQNPAAKTTMMFAYPSQQGKVPESPMNEKRIKRSAEPFSHDTQKGKKNETENVYGGTLKRRTLLQYVGSDVNVNRRQKFIRHYGSGNNWTRELTQITDKDLEDQKLKTQNFPSYWKNSRFASADAKPTNPPPTRTYQSLSPVFRRIKKRERTAANVELKQNQTDPTATPTLTPQKLVWDYKTPPRRYQAGKYAVEEDFKNSWYNNRTQSGQQNNTHSSSQNEATTATLQNTLTTQNYAVTTPRNRKLEYLTRSAEQDDYDKYGDQEMSMSQTPALGLDLNTYQTYPVYNYYNHRPSSSLYRENQTSEEYSPEPEIDRIHNEVVTLTTESPLFHPTKTAPSYSKQPYYEKIKYRKRYPYHHNYYHTRNHYPVDTRYRYSPYRKSGTQEPAHFHDHHHDDYYPVVIAKYPQDEEAGFDLIKFVWTMLTSFAKPLTKLVPSFAKDNNEEPQCYDLLVCEAQRVSRFMGPTAEALATTVGTLLTWAATEETRQLVIEAINSGRENTCQQQIRDCEDRSGGKSAMTVIAQVMEIKPK